MKKTLLIVFGILVALPLLMSQEEDFFSSGSEGGKGGKERKERKLDKWAFGGNFWLSFGNNTSYIEVSPIVMYKAHPRLMVGPGFTYIYQKNRFAGYETSTYGPRALATYTLFKDLKESININIGNIVLHSEYEYLSIEIFELHPPGKLVGAGRTWVNNFLVGGGIYQPIGNRGGISIIILYNLIDNKYSPYSNPVFRFGFYF